MGSPLNRTAPPSRLAVRHDRPQSGWRTVDDRLLVAPVADHRLRCPGCNSTINEPWCPRCDGGDVRLKSPPPLTSVSALRPEPTAADLVPVGEVVAWLREEAERYEREFREHRGAHGRDESKSVREKKRAQARALARAADALRARYPVTP